MVCWVVGVHNFSKKCFLFLKFFESWFNEISCYLFFQLIFSNKYFRYRLFYQALAKNFAKEYIPNLHLILTLANMFLTKSIFLHPKGKNPKSPESSVKTSLFPI